MTKKEPGFLYRMRRSKHARLIIMTILIAILAVMWFAFEKARAFILGMIIVMLAAVGIELFNYDLDLGTLWNTGSIEQSRVQTKNGVKLIGACIADDLNCSHFKTQPEAQSLYNKCAEEIKSYNAHLEGKDVKSFDVYGLDRDKDGLVCEALPAS
ncbi:hypothetical protein CSB37_03640 [bacterium DOLZORAL124_38_8]|nr:MAG: hypothetical protein CSB37_03640 [bacterium DOLZORAL124_38_8]